MNKKIDKLLKFMAIGCCLSAVALIIVLQLNKTQVQKFINGTNAIVQSYTTTESNSWDVSANEDGSITATLLDDGTLNISGSGDMMDYDWYNDRSPWYSKRAQIKNIKIENGMIEIGENAFYNCHNVKSIEIPDSVIKIGDAAFYECWNLEYVKLPETLSSLEDHLFSHCYNLNSIAIPNSVKTIGKYTFQLTNLTKIKIPEGVTSIGHGAFYLCENLRTVEISSTVTSINVGAFSNCESLRKISVDDDNNVYIDIDGVLYTKNYKELIKYPRMKLNTEYVILDGVETISFDAFDNCYKLKSVTIPASTIDISADAFNGCYSLTEIKVNESNSNYMDDNGVLYTKNKTKIIKYPEGKVGEEYDILTTVTSIGEYAFYNCNNLTSIEVPNSVTSIGDEAFYFCENLTSIDIPERVTEMGNGAFYGCKVTQFITTENTTLEIPKILKTAKDENHVFIFTNCTIEDDMIKIDEGETLAEIEIDEGNLEGLTYIISHNLWDVSKEEDQSIIATLSNDGTLTISGTGDMKDYSYTNPSPWSDIKYKINHIKIEDGITSIGEESFEGSYNLINIEIPSSIISIGEDSFDSCERIMDLEIPEGVIEIGNYAFWECCNLIDIEIPSTVTTIGDDAFEYCYSLISIIVNKDNLNYMDDNGVLYTKDGSQIVKYPQGKIDTYYTILKNATNIKEYAFSECYDLTNIYIPKSIINIEDYAFDYCYNLTLICYKDSMAITYAQENDINYIAITNKVQPQTQVEQIKQEMGTDAEYKITDENGETITDVTYVTTGYKIEMSDGESYTIIVEGDANGDGVADIRDILAINKYRLGKANLELAYLLASDVNEDDVADIRDILQINKFRLGKTETL